MIGELGRITGVMPTGDGGIRLTIKPADGVRSIDLLGRTIRFEGTCESHEVDGVNVVDQIIDVHSIHLVDEDAG